MKQSIYLILLQIVSILLGFFSIFYVAANLSPKIYSIVGVLAVINSLVVVFSNTGLETYAIRNVLNWQKENKINNIKEIVTQAITLRTMIAIFLQVPLFFYYSYISHVKFNGYYLNLFFIFGLFSIPRATLDSVNLILKSFNKYFISVLSSYSVQVFGKIIALILFTQYGFTVYILTLVVLPLIILIPVSILLKNYISLEYIFKFKKIKKNLKYSWKFAIASYISYPFNYLDSLIISISVSPQFFGSFIMGKRMYQIGKQFIENVFDPMTQKLIQYKSNSNTLELKLAKIFRIQRVLLIIAVLTFFFFSFYLKRIIVFLGIGHYPFLNYFFLIIIAGQIVHIIMKVKFNFIGLFYSSMNYLKLNILYSISSIFFLLILLQFSIKWIFFYSFLTNLVILIYSQYLFKINKGVSCIYKY